MNIQQKIEELFGDNPQKDEIITFVEESRNQMLLEIIHKISKT